MPAAFVVPLPGAEVTMSDLVEHVGGLPKTATGKILKFALRDQLWAGRDRRVN